MDEATSSLDTNSEKAIQKTIYSFKGRQTLIIIAHRLTTVEDCDKVIWLEKGRKKMIGKPDKVLRVYNDSNPNIIRAGSDPNLPKPGTVSRFSQPLTFNS